MELEDKLIQATSKTFGKFAELLAKVDPIGAFVVTGAVIAPVVCYAVGVEVLHQREVFEYGGRAALDAYREATHLKTLDFVALAVADALPSASANLVGKSMLAIATLPLTACLSVLTAGKFQNLKKEIATLEQGGRDIDRSLNRQVEYPVRESCATRLSNVERFDRSFEALSRKIVAVQDQEAAQASAHTPAGPRP
ncbi:hypothetical protein [Pseudomonas sp.]|uniref:hypothetical protein n=1 Tax=Pseudomonas sp. TaxID=306 RepID=UPI0029081A36|nr:hypothetical protein [Pseudomonas sp.]MDU4254572.1 hypothetical protein [Pseudomonas sp.]